MSIGQNIRALRKKRGITQAGLGAACGITAGAVSSYENGVTLPKRRTLERIAAALDVPPALLTDSRRPNQDPPLYDGILAALRELYGTVEARVLVGEEGTRRRYYVVDAPGGRFILHESDIAAIASDTRAALAPLARSLQSA